MAPLAGTIVVDVCTAQGEMAGRVLADLGATVIKLEPPRGTDARALAPWLPTGESLYWASVGRGKQSAVCDVLDPQNAEPIRRLLEDADIFIESFTPGRLTRLGLDAASLAKSHPHLIYVSISSFGQTGPKALTPANDLTLEAAGGLIGLQGDPDRVPLPISFPQAAFHAGVQAASDALIALYAARHNTLGQHLDVSTQAAVIWILMNATGYPSMTQANPPGMCEQRALLPPELVPGVRLPRMLPCANGFVVLGIHQPGIGERTFSLFMREANRRGLLTPDLAAVDWTLFFQQLRSGAISTLQAQAAISALRTLIAQSTKQEWMQFSLQDAALIAPVNNTIDLLADPQLGSRDFWTHIKGRIHPGPFAKLSATPLLVDRGAPALGDQQAILSAFPKRKTRTLKDHRQRAFAGLKVADFAWVGVGPMIAKALADHGATVVHVESAKRPDVLRNLPPFQNNQPAPDRGQFQPNFNTSKLGLALDLTNEQGREVARELIDWADVVIESFTPGNMEKWGLDYRSLSANRDDLVMLSTCMRGQTGPERRYGGFGNQGAALAGLVHITGWPDRPPVGPWGAYTDFIAPRYGTAALVAALLHRQETGQGQYIDISQIEAGIQFIEPLLLDQNINGVTASAMGFDARHAVPHGVYRCAGEERYLTIAAETTEQWRALCNVLKDPELDPNWSTVSVRRQHQARIDAALSRWCATNDPFRAQELLWTEGIAAHVVAWPTDLYQDPQLRHRRFFVPLQHATMGEVPYDGLVTRFSGLQAGPFSAGPLIGQHTDEVLRDLLHFAPERIAALRQAGALT